MNYQWDPQKANSNLKKHGIRFAYAVVVFADEHAITIEDGNAHVSGENGINKDILPI